MAVLVLSGVRYVRPYETPCPASTSLTVPSCACNVMAGFRCQSRGVPIAGSGS